MQRGAQRALAERVAPQREREQRRQQRALGEGLRRVVRACVRGDRDAVKRDERGAVGQQRGPVAGACANGVAADIERFESETRAGETGAEVVKRFQPVVGQTQGAQVWKAGEAARGGQPATNN